MHIVDFAILAGMLEEFEVIRDHLPGMEELGEDGSTTWYRTRLVGGDRNYEIVVAYQDGMGPLQADALTHAAISKWNPAQILLLGIAGSLDKDVRLGDVVVSQQVFYYSPAKETGKATKFRPEGYPGSVLLLRRLEALRADEKDYAAWRADATSAAAKLADELESANPDADWMPAASAALRAHQPGLHFGSLASGHAVVASRAMKKELLALHGKLLATEMEGAGVLHAAYYHEPPTRAIVVKGISDAADPHKAAEDAKGWWRKVAKNNSVLAALHLIRRGRIAPVGTDQFDIDPRSGPVAEACNVIKEGSTPGICCLGFPRLVVPRGPLTRLEVHAEAQGAGKTPSIARFVLRYLDRNLERREERREETSVAAIAGPVARSPIGLYVLLRETPTKIEFTVKTPLEEKKMTWEPGPHA